MESININTLISKSAVIPLAVCLLIFSIPALSQTGGQYDLSWNTIDGGGWRSAGGQYVLTGTIGQPDAAYSAGGSYELFGGFWAISCFPYWHLDYADWIDVGKPGCWCYPRQCHGDADNSAEGDSNWWVAYNDLEILQDAWNKPIEDMVGNEICADFDHAWQGLKKHYRVAGDDLGILKRYWKIPNGPDPNCFEGY